MKNSFIIFVWFTCCVGSVVAGVITFYLTKNPSYTMLSLNGGSEERLASAEQLPELQKAQGIETSLATDDARPQIVANFLTRYKSPLEPADQYGRLLVQIADKYGIDFRLLPAIAMQESGLCKNIPEGSHNCLGFGIHKRGTLGFESYEAAFERAGREIKQNYIDQGRTTPEQIMAKYTPSSNGSWANSVNQWMAEMRYDDRQLGRDLKQPGANVMEFAGGNLESAGAATPEASPATGTEVSQAGN
jgi:hypothetical protein